VELQVGCRIDASASRRRRGAARREDREDREDRARTRRLSCDAAGVTTWWRARNLLPAAVALGLAAVFLKTAREVVENEWTQGETWLELTVHQLASPGVTEVMRGFTFLGSAVALVPLGIAVAAWCVARRQRRQALWLAIVALGALGANVLLKLAFARARPALWPEALHLATYSFPSGHSMSSAATLGMIAVVVARLEPRTRLAASVLTPLLVLGVGVSRVYLGAHWPSDVLAGWAAGSLVLVGGAWASRPGKASPGAAGPVPASAD
jgi:membrane-associated phospholipid phosphatase